jgi:hypothetical protein
MGIDFVDSFPEISKYSSAIISLFSENIARYHLLETQSKNRCML